MHIALNKYISAPNDMLNVLLK